jgi:hypothetical protein
MLYGQAVVRHWRDFGFDSYQMPCYSTAGTLYYRRMPFGMPRIPPQILQSPFYLYESLEEAKAGTPFGGTGFFVGYPTGIADRHHVYAVTNWHVAVRDGASVIRVNKKDGGFDCFELGPEDWEFKPGGYDLAVAFFPHLRVDVHEVVVIETGLFVTQQLITQYTIGPGDDVFMLGRFVDHEGVARNVPSARFGNISMMPQAIEQPTGAKGLPSFVLDVHSRTGYSGSPVFVYRTMGSDLTTNTLDLSSPATHFIALLGIHWGQFPEMWEVAAGDATIAHSVKVSGDERYVRGMSGMTLAIPAWTILEMLEMPKFKQQRMDWFTGRLRATSGYPVAEAATKQDENPDHREDFNRLVSAASRPKPKDDRT